MNPNIHNRWGLLCPSCGLKLINPNQPWPHPCDTCGQRTHVKCLQRNYRWLVDLDETLDPHEEAVCCAKCIKHSVNNAQLIRNLPQASGSQDIDVYRAWKARQPKTAPKPVKSLWGPYRIDPDNFVPAVTKVLDIVHSEGPKVRWAVKLAGWDQVPMTNLSSKEILLPNYFDSPNALGRTHQEILDAMTGAAMHEAGHAAYDKSETLIEAQRRIKLAPGQNTWAAATCLNIVCDYNLERKVIERYPAFRHYFSECHRWSVRDSLPDIVNAMQQPDAEDRLNVRIAVLTWEMLGPGDLENAGASITPKLRWITRKCFDILKYSYTRGYLNTEPGKLKTARALYELIRVVNPIGAPGPTPTGLPQPQQPQGQPQGQQGGQPPDDGSTGVQGVPGGSQGSPQQSDDQQSSDDDQPTSNDVGPGTRPHTESEDNQEPDDVSDAQGQGQADSPSGDPGDTGQDASESDSEPDSSETDQDAESQKEPGDQDADGHGSGTDPGQDDASSDSSDDVIDDDSTTGAGAEEDSEDSSEDSEAQDNDDGSSSSEHVSDNTGPEGADAGRPVGQHGDSSRGGMSGSEQGPDPKDDPFTGAGDLQDDPKKRKNSTRDALDDLNEENKGLEKGDERFQPEFTKDEAMDARHRMKTETLANPPAIEHRTVPKAEAEDYRPAHTARVTELAPVVSRLKKILRFRNADWGGKQTGRRSGTLTRRHVSRLSTLGTDKVFHKTQPDATPKVRIALLVDESESMNYSSNQPTPLYIGARNAATALMQALHGIRGVKLWTWGYSMNISPSIMTGRRHVPNMRLYSDPFHTVDPVSIEAIPMSGGTPTGEAMDFAAETISKGSTPDEKKVVFIITDGEAGGVVSTATSVRKWTGKVTFVHIGLGNTVDKDIPFYIGPITDITLLPDLLSESVSEILK